MSALRFLWSYYSDKSFSLYSYILYIVYFLISRLSDHISGGLLAEGLSVARYEKIVPKILNVELSFQSLAYQMENEKYRLNDQINVIVDKVSIFDTEGNM